MSHIIAFIFSFVLLLSPALAGDEARPPGSQLARQAQERAEMLDRLFARLKQAEDAEAAKRVERTILAQLRKSESPTANLLLQQAMAAMVENRNEEAVDVLDAVIDQHPDFTEALNQRATALYLMGEYDRSADDIAGVLEAEPRHFGALAGLGLVRRAQGREQEALEAFRAALAVHPKMEGVAEAVEELARKLEQKI